eukprot:308329-Amorphochlora_amoeboformis.AAC.2
MAARVLGVLSGAAAAGLENQVIQEAAIREIEESHRTALSNAYEEVLQSPVSSPALKWHVAQSNPRR